MAKRPAAENALPIWAGYIGFWLGENPSKIQIWNLEEVKREREYICVWSTDIPF